MSDVLRRLDPLVGRWETTMTHPATPGLTVRGTATFEWYQGVLLLQHLVTDHQAFPDVVLAIGADDTTGGYTICYTDDRDVQRVYRMSLADGVWRQWRDVPGFAQRFTGTFSPAGDAIDGRWELCTDGETWHDDLAVGYRRG